MTMEKFYEVKNYTMKCRLYPNKTQKKLIDNIISGVQCFHNCALYDLRNGINTRKSVFVAHPPKRQKNDTDEKYAARVKAWEEKGKKPPERKADESEEEFIERYNKWEQKQRYKNGDILTLPDFKAMFKAEYKDKLVKENPIIACVPSSAIITNIGLKADMERAWKTSGYPEVKYWDADYYNGKNPRRSYCYNEKLGKISTKDNEKVFFFNLMKVGSVKVRGLNQKIRFDANGSIGFIEYCLTHKDEICKVNVSRDNCGDYHICITLKLVYKPFKNPVNEQVGVDVGIKELAILSDGTKYQNKKYKEKSNPHKKTLSRQVSRRWGWSNKDFRDAHKRDITLEPSKRACRTALKLAKLQRKTARKRKWWNDNVAHDIVQNNALIAIESLNVKGMCQNKKMAERMSDAALYQLLCMIRYKSEWYGRTVKVIGRYDPSSQLCNCCGYRNKDIKGMKGLEIRNWTCPVCGAEHDRDVNAAKNILKFALANE